MILSDLNLVPVQLLGFSFSAICGQHFFVNVLIEKLKQKQQQKNKVGVSKVQKGELNPDSMSVSAGPPH